MTTIESYQTTEAPYFWRAPFARESYREFGYVLSSLPVAIVGLSWAVTLFSLGAGTLVTVLGFPVFALLVTGARGLGRLERGRARRLLGYDVPEPAPVRPKRDGVWGAITARIADPAGWKAVAYQVVMFPWHILSFSLSVTLWATSWSMALLPVYSWVFPTYVGWPGYRLFDYNGRAYYLSSAWQIAGVSLMGIALVFATPALIRALTAVTRGAIRTLLAG